MEFTSGQTQVCIKEIGNKTKYQVMESILGMMEGHIKVTGLTITCTAKGYTPGLMEENMRENTLMIRNTVMEFTLILMADPIKDNGLMVNSMVKDIL